MKLKDNFVEQVILINKLLTCFPDASPTIPADSILDNEILDLLESTIPITWQRHMVLQGFDLVEGTIAKLVNFCKHIKLT